jgi:hypothetical protein
MPHPQPKEVVSFTDFHKRGFRISVSNFLPTQCCSWKASSSCVRPSWGSSPTKTYFARFKVKTHKAHGSNGMNLQQASPTSLVGGMNLQTHQGVSRNSPCLPLKTSNSSWRNHWFYIHDDAAAPLPSFSSTALLRLESWGLGVWQEEAVEGGRDPRDSCRLSVD